MRKKSEKCRRRLMALLAAVCMFSAIPYTPVTASESTVSIESEDKEIQEQTEAEETGNSKDESGQIKEADESETDGSEQTEEQEKESTGTEEAENPEDSEEKDDSETGEGEESEKDGEAAEEEEQPEETEEEEQPDEMEAEETEDEENPDEEDSEESLMLLADEAEGDAVTDGTYTDENGITYHYYGYEDGTANIYKLVKRVGKDVNIPAYIDGYKVTQLTFYTWGDFPSVTIPETITYIGKTVFAETEIQTLYYNATEEVQVEAMPSAPFRHAKIGSLITGENVHIIPAYIFSYSEFQGDITITAEAVGEEAFEFATFPSLTLTKQVQEIQKNAFRGTKIQTLYYDTEAEHKAFTTSEGVFRSASIYELVIGESITEIPDYAFCTSNLRFDKCTINVERIGKHAFEKAWSSSECCAELVLSEQVKYIGADAFAGNYITTLVLEASAESDAADTSNGCFYNTHITNLSIGESVTVIPDYMFCNAYTMMNELTLNVESIGKYAFYRFSNIMDLTIGENVKEIGIYAFASDSITNVYYNAVNATYKNDAVTGPFASDTLSRITFGDKVESLPNHIFQNVKYTADALVFPDSLREIGENAFDSSGLNIGVLIIGENVTHMGAWAFGKGTYDRAVIYATQSDCAVMPYYNESYLPVCGSVEIHGNAAGYQYFTAKTEEENITLMCEDFETTYGEENYDEEENTCVSVATDTCVVCGYEIVREEKVDAYTVLFKQPGGGLISSQHVHSGKDAVEPEAPERTGYEFTGWDKDFTNVTSNITVTAQYKVKTFSVVFKDGEDIISEQEIEYGRNAEVPENPARPKEEWGTWKFTGWNGNYKNVMQDEIIQAQFEKVINKYEVVFHDAEGNVISRQTVPHGESAEVPEAPEKKSTAQYTYTFTGWNGDTDNVTGNTDFYPVYKAATRSYTVTFVNNEEVLSTQSVEYGKDASAPENPKRAEEEWGTWKFTGWDSDYTNIAKDMTVRAQFEQVFHEYEVIFYDEDGNVLSRQTVKHGHAAKAPKAPEKEPTEEFCYPFTGWSGDITNITADSAFYPTYGKETRTYTVTFMNGNTVFNKQTVKYGKSAVTPIEPKKEADAKYSYIFTGWDGDYSVITGDTVIHALYEQKEIPSKGKPGKEEETEKKNEENGGGNDDDDGDGNGGDDETEPAPDNGGEKPEPETEADNVEKPDDGTGKVLVKQECNGEAAQVTEPETEEYAEIVTKPLTEDTDDAETAQETAEVPEEDNRGISVLGWFILIIGIILLAFLFFWLLFLYFARRKVCGTILYESGNVPCGMQVTLSGKDIMEAEPDEDGFFSFDVLKKDDYSLNVYDGDGYKIFSADIRMESGSGEDVYIILDSVCSNAETSEKRGKYEVNLTV